MAKLNLDLTGVKPAGMSKTDYIPDGKYNAKISEVDLVETKSGYGLSFYFEILDGEQQGKVVRKYLTAVNSNSEENERISKGYIKSILISCEASNPELLSDTDEILGKTLSLTTKTKVEEYEGNKIEKSDPVKFSQMSKDEVVAKKPAPKSAATEAAKKKPWE